MKKINVLVLVLLFVVLGLNAQSVREEIKADQYDLICSILLPLCIDRIKPESKYRPFIDNKECWNEMLKHQPFGWVRTMNAESDYYIIDGVLYSENIDCSVATMAGESYDYKEMLDIYLFADGTPFGIKI